MTGISVIIPLYNKIEGVRRAIRSVLDQDVTAEVVVVDDGSTDGSAEAAAEFGDRIRLIRQANAGPSAARNRAVAASCHPVLAFLDADDELLPGCLAGHLECRRSRTGVQVTLAPFRVLVGDRVVVEETIVDRELPWAREGRFHYVAGFHPELVRGFVGSSVCVDRELFDAANGFDADLHCWEIADLLYRLLVRGTVVGVLDRTSILVHGSYTDGQWGREHAKLGHRVRQAHNLVDHLDALCVEHQRTMLRGVEGTLRALLTAGDTREFRRLGERIGARVSVRPTLRSLSMLARLPEPLLRGASLLYRAAGSRRGTASRPAAA